MKNLKKISKFFLLALAVATVSCSDDDNGGGGTPAGFYLTAKIDGQNYSNNDFADPSVIVTGSMLNIISSSNSGDAIQIQIPNYAGEGTYNSGNNDLMAGYINYTDMGATPGQFTAYTSVRGVGQVIITDVTDTQIEGTFTATVFENVDGSTNDKSITDGSFRLEL